jgi:hypothetical protein
MNSSIPNIAPAASPKPSTTASEEAATEANRRLADKLVKSAVEGLNRLAREKAAAKNPRHAA